jgi:hypothetical protein
VLRAQDSFRLKTETLRGYVNVAGADGMGESERNVNLDGRGCLLWIVNHQIRV